MEITAIKQALTLKQVLAHYDLTPKNGMIHCPFHEDKTPSMQIFLDTHTVRCYSGNCPQGNQTIDVIDFIMYKENLTKHQAILRSQEILDFKLETSEMRDSKLEILNEQKEDKNNLESKIQNSPLPLRIKEYQELPMHKLEEIFYKMKQNHRAKSLDYLKQRALDPNKLDIGYNGRTYKGLINSIVFPLKDKHGKIVSLYGRNILNKTSAGRPGHYYLKNRNGLYPCYPSKETKTLILTESIIDAATLLQLDNLTSQIQNLSILAGYGTNGFTAEHTETVSRLTNLQEIILAYDTDEAGVKASIKLAQQLNTTYPKLLISTLELPSKDINETLQLHTPEIFPELIQNRTPLFTSTEKENPSLTTQAIEEKQEKEAERVVPAPSASDSAQSSTKPYPSKIYNLQTINQLIGRSGIIGEENTRLLLFIIAGSYKTKNPLHAIIQGSSGSGKTHLISKIADLMPQEDVLRFTRITESSLYNWGEYDLVNKHLIIEDLDGLKEEALYALRELISSQRLSSSVSIKDKKGNIKSVKKEVKGRFSSLSATTKADTYEDNISRSFTLAVDESSSQSQQIINYQNLKYAGELSTETETRAKKELQTYIRNLLPYPVVNPYATQLELPPEAHKIRRLNQMYQTIVSQITWLNQRERKLTPDKKLLTTIEDLQQAAEILFESIILKVDELDGSLRQFYEKLKNYISRQKTKNQDKEQHFTQREIRQALLLSKAQCSRYINTLIDLEYITSKYAGNLRKVTYQIDYWDDYHKLRKRIKDQLLEQITRLEQTETNLEQ